MFKKLTLVSIVFITTFACSDKGVDTSIVTDNFDRAEMLEFWADGIIIPAYDSYVTALGSLKSESTAFYADPTAAKLEALRGAWLAAYLAWQEVSMFEIGKAEKIGIRNFTNIYPCNVDLVHTHIDEVNYNLELPSTFAAQGFPALDYLLYGSASDDDTIISFLSSDKTKTYTVALIDRLTDLSRKVLDDWNQNFRNEFISNSGSSASAATDKMVNDFLFYYERHLRAAKIGIPTGIFSGTESGGLVEGRYSGDFSKQLLEKSFSAVQDFFSGVSFDGQRQGLSLKQYLDLVHTENKTEFDYSASIIAQWESATQSVNALRDNFKEQIEEDNMQMLVAYDEFQKVIVLLKVDMLQALNIQVDFVDADGD